MYNVRKAKGKNGYIAYSLTIPNHVAEVLPEDVQFSIELTDEGILYRPAQSVAETVDKPAWISGEGETPKRVKLAA